MAASVPQSIKRDRMMIQRSQVYIAPMNFGMVGEQLYRSGQPNELNFPFLEKLGLRTVIFLSDEPINPRFGRFLDEMGIVLHHIENDVRNSPWGTISEEGILKALELILDTSNYPIIITCLLGRHRTGTVVGCLRKLQHWNLASIFEEYRRYAGPKARAANEQFIELFDTDLVRSYRSQSKIPVELLADESETCEERDDGVKSRTIIFRNKI